MLVEFERVGLSRGGAQILQDVTVSLAQSRVGIIGPNGAGKSSLARLINGLLIPQTGQVRVNGLEVASNLKWVRRQVGFLFQNPDNQIVFPVVREDMGFGLKSLIPDAKLRAQRIEETLSRLDILELLDRPVHTLSGGQKQLVALATVLCTEPALLVLDEPTTALDLRYRNRLMTILEGVGQAAILLTHDLALLDGFDRVLVVAEQGIANDAPPDQAIAWYERHYA